MMSKTLATSLLLVSGAFASPLIAREETYTAPAATSTASPEVYDWSAGWQKSFPIHESCNSTLHRQLAQGLEETIELATHARDHLLRWGTKSEFVQKYFGNGTTSTPIGWYERIINADKSSMLFRCDDPDKNCATQKGWAGHWRGSNATEETVICSVSFESRRFLNSVCNLGYTVAGKTGLKAFWAVDLMHRVLHVPTISENVVDHYTENYEEVLELGASNSTDSAIDSDTLQFFAIDVYAFDIAAPGVGCTGEVVPESAAQPSGTASSAPSATSEAPKECHTHENGVVHCS